MSHHDKPKSDDDKTIDDMTQVIYDNMYLDAPPTCREITTYLGGEDLVAAYPVGFSHQGLVAYQNLEEQLRAAISLAFARKALEREREAGDAADYQLTARIGIHSLSKTLCPRNLFEPVPRLAEVEEYFPYDPTVDIVKTTKLQERLLRLAKEAMS